MNWKLDLLKAGYVVSTIRELFEKARGRKVNFPIDPFEKWFPTDVAKQLQYLKAEPDAFNSDYMLKLHAKANWVGCPPELREFAEKLFRQFRKDGVPMYVHTVYRSPELQYELASAGFSKVLSGPHQRSCALDIVHAYHHWDCPKEFWLYVGMTGKRIAKQMRLGNGTKIDWGGDESGNQFAASLRDPNDRFKWDPAHWQLSDWINRAKVLPDGFHEVSTPYSATRITTGNYNHDQ
jgi:hypothetical protein